MIESLDAEQCLFLIPSPRDATVYQCFRTIAQRWPKLVTEQSLVIESDLPLTPGLTARELPSAIAKLIAVNADVITGVVLRFGGLKLSYVRSGGHGPDLYRQSYFDEVGLECNGPATIDRQQLNELAQIVCEDLGALGASGTPGFASLAEVLPLRVRSFSPENRA